MKHSYWKRILAISMGMVLAVNTGLGALMRKGRPYRT